MLVLIQVCTRDNRGWNAGRWDLRALLWTIDFPTPPPCLPRGTLSLQGYLAHKTMPPRRTLQQP